MENWTTEWVFIIGAVVLLIVAYVKRDKIRNLAGGKPSNQPKLKRK